MHAPIIGTCSGIGQKLRPLVAAVAVSMARREQLKGLRGSNPMWSCRRRTALLRRKLSAAALSPAARVHWRSATVSDKRFAPRVERPDAPTTELGRVTPAGRLRISG